MLHGDSMSTLYHSQRLHRALRSAQDANKTALIPYITAGDPDLATTAKILDALVEAGSDVIELGIPFSDPMGDGKTIQAAMARALSSGTTFTRVLKLVTEFRSRHAHTPLILFGYTNPLYRFGLEAASEAAREAGADGFLIVDLPPEEASELTEHTRSRGLDFICLFTPTTAPERFDTIRREASGFAYCVSMTGVTGGAMDSLDDLGQRVATIRSETGLPVAVGFGIRSPEDACRVARVADGVVVGSALIEAMASCASEQAPAIAGQFIGSIRSALDAASRT